MARGVFRGYVIDCRFAEIPLPGGIYYNKDTGEYCNKFSDEKVRVGACGDCCWIGAMGAEILTELLEYHPSYSVF